MAEDKQKDYIFRNYGLGRDPCTRGDKGIKCRNYNICKSESLACVDFLRFVGIKRWSSLDMILDKRQPSREVYDYIFSSEEEAEV